MRRTVSGIACGVAIGIAAALGARAATGPATVPGTPAVAAICPDATVSPRDVRPTPDAALCGARSGSGTAATAAAVGRQDGPGWPRLRAPRVVDGLACASAATVIDALDRGCGADDGARRR